MTAPFQPSTDALVARNAGYARRVDAAGLQVEPRRGGAVMAERRCGKVRT